MRSTAVAVLTLATVDIIAEAHALQFAYILCLLLYALVLPHHRRPRRKTKTKPKTKAKPTTKVTLPCSTDYLTQLEETAQPG